MQRVLLHFLLPLTLIRFPGEISARCNPKTDCGCSTAKNPTPRIVGGETTTFKAWPWIVSIHIDSSFFCGGSILSESWIITAAHCLADIEPSSVRINAGANTHTSRLQTRDVSEIFVHPNYNNACFSDDIALLKLMRPLDMDAFELGFICFPSIDSTLLKQKTWPKNGTSVITIGWGALTDGGPLSNTLRKVTLQIIDDRSPRCNESICDGQIQICAGAIDNSRKDTCQGDSGGPLMLLSETNQWVLVGLTSSGIGCAQPGEASSYTRITAYLDWIESILNSSSLNFNKKINRSVQHLFSRGFHSCNTMNSAFLIIFYLLLVLLII